MADCIFCKIVAGKIPSEIVYQDDELFAFRDINPVAPTHILIIPKKHVPSCVDLTEADTALAGKMIVLANRLARSEGVSEKGYRLAINCGRQGGQLVPHLHLHLIGGRQFSVALG